MESIKHPREKPKAWSQQMDHFLLSPRKTVPKGPAVWQDMIHRFSLRIDTPDATSSSSRATLPQMQLSFICH
jgi:hypothetical protein